MDLIQLFNYLGSLRPFDLSVTMFVFTCVDLWTALSLATKTKSLLSKTLMRGFLSNLLVIMIPYLLGVVDQINPAPEGSADYIQVLSVVVTILYILAVSGSIIANYSAAYPEGKNLITKFAYRYLNKEVQSKKDKHGLE